MSLSEGWCMIDFLRSDSFFFLAESDFEDFLNTSLALLIVLKSFKFLFPFYTQNHSQSTFLDPERVFSIWMLMCLFELWSGSFFIESLETSFLLLVFFQLFSILYSRFSTLSLSCENPFELSESLKLPISKTTLDFVLISLVLVWFPIFVISKNYFYCGL